MTLKELIFSICNDGEETYGTLLDTTDESFPEKYRFKGIHFAGLFREAKRSGEEEADRLLNRVVKSISLQPQVHTIPSRLANKGITEKDIFEKYPLRYNNVSGFCIEVTEEIPFNFVVDRDYNNPESSIHKYTNVYHFAAVIKIVLEKEGKEDEIQRICRVVQ